MKTIDLVYINAGGGHRSAATALEMAIRNQARDWQVRLVNLFEVLDPQDMFRKTTGVRPEHYYNVRLARGWTLGLAQELRILQTLIRLSHKSLDQSIAPPLAADTAGPGGLAGAEFQPRDVSSREAAAAACAVRDGTHRSWPIYRRTFWIEPDQAQHLHLRDAACGGQARAAGYDDAHIHETCGMIISPDFYREPGRGSACRDAKTRARS